MSTFERQGGHRRFGQPMFDMDGRNSGGGQYYGRRDHDRPSGLPFQHFAAQTAEILIPNTAQVQQLDPHTAAAGAEGGTYLKTPADYVLCELASLALSIHVYGSEHAKQSMARAQLAFISLGFAQTSREGKKLITESVADLSNAAAIDAAQSPEIVLTKDESEVVRWGVAAARIPLELGQNYERVPLHPVLTELLTFTDPSQESRSRKGLIVTSEGASVREHVRRLLHTKNQKTTE